MPKVNGCGTCRGRAGRLFLLNISCEIFNRHPICLNLEIVFTSKASLTSGPLSGAPVTYATTP